MVVKLATRRVGPRSRRTLARAEYHQTLTTVEGAMGAGDLARLRESVSLLAEAAGLLTAAPELMGAGGQ